MSAKYTAPKLCSEILVDDILDGSATNIEAITMNDWKNACQWASDNEYCSVAYEFVQRTSDPKFWGGVRTSACSTFHPASLQEQNGEKVDCDYISSLLAGFNESLGPFVIETKCFEVGQMYGVTCMNVSPFELEEGCKEITSCEDIGALGGWGEDTGPETFYNQDMCTNSNWNKPEGCKFHKLDYEDGSGSSDCASIEVGDCMALKIGDVIDTAGSVVDYAAQCEAVGCVYDYRLIDEEGKPTWIFNDMLNLDEVVCAESPLSGTQCDASWNEFQCSVMGFAQGLRCAINPETTFCEDVTMDECADIKWREAPWTHEVFPRISRSAHIIGREGTPIEFLFKKDGRDFCGKLGCNEATCVVQDDTSEVCTCSVPVNCSEVVIDAEESLSEKLRLCSTSLDESCALAADLASCTTSTLAASNYVPTGSNLEENDRQCYDFGRQFEDEYWLWNGAGACRKIQKCEDISEPVENLHTSHHSFLRNVCESFQQSCSIEQDETVEVLFCKPQSCGDINTGFVTDWEEKAEVCSQATDAIGVNYCLVSPSNKNRCRLYTVGETGEDFLDNMSMVSHDYAEAECAFLGIQIGMAFAHTYEVDDAGDGDHDGHDHRRLCADHSSPGVTCHVALKTECTDMKLDPSLPDRISADFKIPDAICQTINPRCRATPNGRACAAARPILASITMGLIAALMMF